MSIGGKKSTTQIIYDITEHLLRQFTVLTAVFTSHFVKHFVHFVHDGPFRIDNKAG